MIRALVALLLIALWPATALAEAEPPADSTRMCFRARDRSRCGSFLITEAGLLGVLRSDVARRQWLGFVELGAMKNVGPRSAAGLTVLYMSGSDHSRVGFRGRYRRWLGNGFSLDLAPGILIPDGDNQFPRYKSPGVVGMVGLDAGGLVGIMVEGEVARIEANERVFDGTGYTWRIQRQTDLTLRAGVRGGSHIGAGSILLWALGAALLSGIHT
jgi:hypothetical protein